MPSPAALSPDSPALHPSTARRRLSRALAFARSEYGAAVLALAAIALHLADDNYLRPQPGTSPGDHLASGLVPIAVLVGVALAVPRLRGGPRAAVLMTAGALGVAFGIPGLIHIVGGTASGDHWTSPVALAGGLVLLGLGAVTLWRSRRRGGSRRSRYLRRGRSVVLGTVTALVLFVFVAFPVGFSYGYTHVGRTGAETPLGTAFERVTVTTEDGIDLSARYVPSRNRAAVVVYPGGAAVAEGRMLARNGYGVLFLDPRGQGDSEGDLVRWAGDRDLNAAARYLQTRADVDPERIGGFGSSIGGEMLLVTAAQSDLFRAVVSEGAGGYVGDDDSTGAAAVLGKPVAAIMAAATTLFSNHGKPPPIAERIGAIAPRPVFLIYATPGMGGEAERQPTYFANAGEPKAIWRVPGAGHTGGIDARPAEYERRVIAFLDGALLDA